MNNLEKQFITTLKSIETERRLDRVFFDFVQLGALAISNAVDMAQRDERETQYLETIRRYTKDEAESFKRCFHILVEIMATGYGDHLGHLFMNLDLGNDRLGQYFSPYDLSKLTASMILDKENVYGKIKEKGFVTLNEPTVGGGGMVIAAADILAEMGYNPQKQMHIRCQDLDITAVYMTYLQLSLFGIPAVVIHGDTLRLEARSVWYTPMYILNNWSSKL